MENLDFDVRSAQEISEAFFNTCGVCCRVVSRSQTVFSSDGAESCRRCPAHGHADGCAAFHAKAARQSERFGGRYIYFCRLGLAFCASPILSGGRLAGALIAGPVLIGEEDDLEYPVAAADALPRMEPRRFAYLSEQLFANAVYISDSGHELFLSRDENRRQDYIGDYISRFKDSDDAPAYPAEEERALFSALQQGDAAAANNRLNELLSRLFFATGDSARIYELVREIPVVLSRAAIFGGADSDTVLDLCRRCTRDLNCLSTQQGLTDRLAAYLAALLSAVADGAGSADVRSPIRAAMEFMKRSCARPITLEDAARCAGYSPSYFSRIFRQETGSSFKEYLNALRIEKSKVLLLSGNLSVAEVCTLCGFNDQSYFCRTFKSLCGTTPDKFRKRLRRIDADREYGRK